MTLEQWAYIGEIAASLAVIASLVYVARQLKQNTNAMIVNNAHSFVEFNNRLNTPFAMDRNFAELWLEAGSDFDSLDAVDKQRLIVWEWQAIAAWSNFFNLRQNGLISNAQWSELEGSFPMFGQRQSVRESWKTFKHLYSREYQQFMDQYFESDVVTPGAD
jgi:hypothetical protein